FAIVEAQHAPDRGTTAASPAEPIAVDEMRHRLCDDDDLVADVTAVFLTDVPVRMADIKAAIAAGDQRTLRATAHALKGAAANMSARPVAECADALEQLALAEPI